MQLLAVGVWGSVVGEVAVASYLMSETVSLAADPNRPSVCGESW